MTFKLSSLFEFKILPRYKMPLQIVLKSFNVYFDSKIFALRVSIIGYSCYQSTTCVVTVH